MRHRAASPGHRARKSLGACRISEVRMVSSAYKGSGLAVCNSAYQTYVEPPKSPLMALNSS